MAKYGLQRVRRPSVAPVTVAEFKQHSRILGRDGEDDYIRGLLLKATEWIEDQTGTAFITTPYVMALDQFPYYIVNRVIPSDYKKSAIILPKQPLAADLITIDYLDNQENTITLTEVSKQLRVARISIPPRVLPAFGNTWPYANVYGVDSVKIYFSAGYGTSGVASPWIARHTITLLTAHWYENREPVNIGNIVNPIPYTLQMGINKLKQTDFVA